MSAFRKDPSPGQKAAFIGLMVGVAWLLAWGCWRLWLVLPWIAGMVASFAAGVGVGLWLRDRRRKALAEVSDWHSEEITAIKLADIHADKAYVTGEHPAIPGPADGEAIEPWINEPWRQAEASKWRLG